MRLFITVLVLVLASTVLAEPVRIDVDLNADQLASLDQIVARYNADGFMTEERGEEWNRADLLAWLATNHVTAAVEAQDRMTYERVKALKPVKDAVKAEAAKLIEVSPILEK